MLTFRYFAEKFLLLFGNSGDNWPVGNLGVQITPPMFLKVKNFNRKISE